MRKVDIVIELDYMSTKYIQNWAERYHHCNPRYFEDVSNLYTDEELKEIERSVGNKNNIIQEWDGESKFRSILMGEIVRRGDRMTKPVEMNYSFIVNVLNMYIKWFDYRIDIQSKQLEIVKNNLEEREIYLIKNKENFIGVLDGSIKLYKELKEEVEEYKKLLQWTFFASQFEKPKIKYIYWLNDDYDELEYCENPNFTRDGDWKMVDRLSNY